MVVAGIGPIAAAPPEPITLNFKDADIDAVVGAFGHLLNRTFIVDPRVRGKITLETPRPVNRDRAFQLLKTVLRQQGFAIIDTGDIVKVVPEADAKLQAGPVEAGRVPSRTGDEIITQVFNLNHESATNLIPILRPLVSPNNTITAFPNNNSLVITDYAANLNRLSRIIASLDNPRGGNDVEIVPVTNAVASDIAMAVSRLLDEGQQRGQGSPGAATDPGQRVTVLADPRTNTVLLRTQSAAKMMLAKSLVERLDLPASGEQANMRVVYLRNAEAVKLVEVLRGVLAGDSTTGGAGGLGGLGGLGGMQSRTQQQSPLQQQSMFQQQNQSQFGGGSSGSSFGQGTQPLGQNQQQQQGPVTINAGGAIIAADPSTNSLIITAAEPLYRQVRGMIDQLDSRRAQLYIESMIVEVSGENAADFGLQWQGLLGKDGDKYGVGIGTNLTVGGPSILALSQTLAGQGTTLPGDGLNIALVKNYGGTYALAAVARALQTQANTNIVSTPNLITLDNEEAKIVVGENVPFITGQFTNTGTATTSPFQTIERKDVGITLRIKPQIGEGGTVRMTIFQEQSAVKETTAAGTSNAGPSTTKRSIESTVVVDDGAILILGGLISDTFTDTKSKVPLLGDIPFLGQLFRAEKREKRRSNLMVFLRPTILRDSNSANKLSLDRYDLIRASQKEAQPPTHPFIPLQDPPVLTPQTAPLPPEPVQVPGTPASGAAPAPIR